MSDTYDVTTAIERLRGACVGVGQYLQGKTSAGPPSRSAALGLYRAEVAPALAEAEAVAPAYSEAQVSAHEAASLCLNEIGAAYRAAQDYAGAEPIFAEAAGIAQGTAATARVQGNLDYVRSRVKLAAAMRSATGAPVLFRINGIGVGLYGRSDEDQATGSYVAGYYITILWAPVFPLARYRVVVQGNRTYGFLGKLPLRPVDRLHQGLGAAGLVALIVLGALAPNTTQYSTTPAAPYQTPTGQPLQPYQPPTGQPLQPYQPPSGQPLQPYQPPPATPYAPQR